MFLMEFLERTGRAYRLFFAPIFEPKTKLCKLAIFPLAAFGFRHRVIGLKTHLDTSYLQQREQRTYEWWSFVTLGAMGPSWKVGSVMVCDGAQRDFFALKKPCPLQADLTGKIESL